MQLIDTVLVLVALLLLIFLTAARFLGDASSSGRGSRNPSQLLKSEEFE